MTAQQEACRLTDEALGVLRKAAKEAFEQPGAPPDVGKLLEVVKRTVGRWSEPAGFGFQPFSLEARGDNPDQQDLSNVKALYEALKHIPNEAAADENFWVYLSVVEYSGYIADRWLKSAANRSGASQGLFRLFFDLGDPNRSLVRQALSRLWWYGKATHDPGRKDPYELTAVLLRTQDVAAAVTERSFSRNPEVAKGFLEALRDLKNGRAGTAATVLSYRSLYREAARHLNQVGAVRMLDALSRQDVKDIVSSYMNRPVQGP